jgi:hypothetical protein
MFKKGGKMIVILLFSLSVNYFTGFKWFYARQTFDASFSKHFIETGFKNFSLEFRWEDLYMQEISFENPKFWSPWHEYLLTTGIFKSFNFKGIQFEPTLGVGSLSYGLREFITFVFLSSFKIKKRIPNTNLVIGVNPSFYLPTNFLKKEFFINRYFTLWVDIGFVIKD